jgi:lysophospholipase L1-like esterase
MPWYKNYSVTFIIFLLAVFSCQAQNASNISFLALGDSYTIGENLPPDHRWPAQLTDSLQARGIEIQEPDIIAETGWTTDELMKNITQENPAKNYDLVSLLIGVNNQYRGYDISSYKTEFEQLLKKAISFADGESEQVFVLSIPDYSVTPFGKSKEPKTIAEELYNYNEVARRICNEYQVSFINITPISKKAANDSTLIADDNLHPSGKMYQQWVSKIIPIVLSKL